jgi:homoserine O-succinyltransferase
VRYLDGIERQRLPKKISGLFRCTKIADHPLVAGLPFSWRIPHSRLNTLDPEQLRAAGYEILSFSDEAGVDAFIQRRQALFLFYQGHPEYHADTLLREYRRDVGRFLDGTMTKYPEMPRGYFAADRAREFAGFRARAQRSRTPRLLEEFPSIDGSEKTPHVWRDIGVRLYANWLAVLAEHRHAAAAHAHATSR